MTIYPAIDIRNGKCVRLIQGDYSKQTIFNENPVQVAMNWEASGGEFIHVVDLDGARSGETVNFETIKNIAKSVSVPVQTGGGIRNMNTIDKMINDAGVSRVILGTSALRNAAFVHDAIAKYGDKIAVGIDAKDGKVAICGWEEVSDTSALSFAAQMEKIGVKYIIYTDIATDGMLKGPNILAMAEMVEHTKMKVIASGGVSCAEDVKALAAANVEGVIIGKALYTGDVKLDEVVML